MGYPGAGTRAARTGMAEHEPGSMDITEQENTFESFVRWTVRVVLAVIIGLIFLAIVNG
jgi:hypothetical protein